MSSGIYRSMELWKIDGSVMFGLCLKIHDIDGLLSVGSVMLYEDKIDVEAFIKGDIQFDIKVFMGAMGYGGKKPENPKLVDEYKGCRMTDSGERVIMLSGDSKVKFKSRQGTMKRFEDENNEYKKREKKHGRKSQEA